MIIHTPKTILFHLQQKEFKDKIETEKPFSFDFSMNCPQNLESGRPSGPVIARTYQCIVPAVYTDKDSGKWFVDPGYLKVIA